MKAVFLVILVAVATTVIWVRPAQSISCDQVNRSLAPCMNYLTSGTGDPSSDCCDGVKGLQSMTPTTGDRRVACDCMKQAAGKYHNIKPQAAGSLPGKCGVQVNVPIRADIDCNSIS